MCNVNPVELLGVPKAVLATTGEMKICAVNATKVEKTIQMAHG